MGDLWDGGSWSPRFIKQMDDWKLEEVQVFFGRLYEHSITLGLEDIMIWLVTKNSIFSVKSFYSSLANRRAELFPYGIIWSSWVS